MRANILSVILASICNEIALVLAKPLWRHPPGQLSKATDVDDDVLSACLAATAEEHGISATGSTNIQTIHAESFDERKWQ
jgi:hypothetical protein